MKKTPDLYTLSSAAEKIGCHKSTASRHAARLKLGLRIGRDVLLSRDEVAQLAGLIAVNEPGNRGPRGDDGRFKPARKSNRR